MPSILILIPINILTRILLTQTQWDHDRNIHTPMDITHKIPSPMSVKSIPLPAGRHFHPSLKARRKSLTTQSRK